MTDLKVLEHKFNINNILKKVFLKVKKHPQSKGGEVIYTMKKTLPRLFRGNDIAFEIYLIEVFTFLFEYTKKHEILVTIEGKKEYIGTENIIFKVKEIDLTTLSLKKLTRIVAKESNILGAKIDYDSKTLTLKIPFAIAELDSKRQYRLPSKSLLQKNVLVVAESKNITLSIMQMFKYFPYNVDMSIGKNKAFNYNLNAYNLLVIEDKLMDESVNTLCLEAQKENHLKIVVLGSVKNINIAPLADISSSLLKPVTQESIFELIVSVFADEYNSETFLHNREKLKRIEELSDIESRKKRPLLKKQSHNISNVDSFQVIVEGKRDEKAPVLNIKQGQINAQSLHLVYDDELENFFDMFNGSDLYFRQIINEKSYKKIKIFYTDLEKYSKIIGAQSMVQFTEMIRMIFVYNKLELLDIYPGRYHIELKKLFKEIEHYFSSEI